MSDYVYIRKGETCCGANTYAVADAYKQGVIEMRVRLKTDLTVNEKAILKDCIIHVSEDELKRDIRGIVMFWAEKRLLEDGWPRPNSTRAIRDYLMENGVIGELTEDEDDL